MKTYKTFAEKDPIFVSHKLQDFAAVQTLLGDLKHDGYYFRGQRDASWKLYAAAQREWIVKNMQSKFSTIHIFIQKLIDFERSQATAQLTAQCPQLNDISVLSTMQHFGAPTPFLDFTIEPDNALFFATDGVQSGGSDETNGFVSIYAVKPGEGAATGTFNDLFNWEKIIDQYGGIATASQYAKIKDLSTIYIKQDSGRFLEITNDRIRKQGGLFLFSPEALNGSKPYEEMFDGMNAAAVVDFYDGLFLPKMVCLDISKSLAPQILAYLQAKGVTKISLELNSPEWARGAYGDFLKKI